MKNVVNFFIGIVFFMGHITNSQIQTPSSSNISDVGPAIIEIDPSVNIRNTQTDIKGIQSDGREYNIPSQTFSFLPSDVEITEVSIDTNFKKLFFLAKKSGMESSFKPVYLVAYNYQEKSMQWGKQSAYRQGMSSFSTTNLFFFGIKRKGEYVNYAFQKETGQLIWNKEFELRTPILSKDIAFNGFLECIDLSTGNIKWSRKLKNDYGWLGDEIVNNNLMFTMVDGIHSINLDDGTGWDFPASTGKSEAEELAGQIVGTAFAITAANILASSVDILVIPDLDNVGYHKKGEQLTNIKSHASNFSGAYTRSGLASNIKIDNHRIYFSAIDKLFCIDYASGKKIWEVRLPDVRTGMASIDVIEDKILFINEGCGYRDKMLLPYFVPYLMLLEKETGKSICIRNIKTLQEPVIDYLLSDSNLYLVTQNEVFTYSINCYLKGKLSSSADSMVRSESGNFNLFLEKPLLKNFFTKSTENKNQFKSLSTINEEGSELFLLTEKGIVCFDRNMRKTLWLPFDDLVVCEARFAGKCLLGSIKENETTKFWIDEQNNGEIIFQIKIPCQSKVEKGHLVIYNTTNSISIIPLSTF